MQPTQTFHEHLKELRLRLIYIILSLGVTGTLSYVLRNPIINFIQKPLHSTLYFTSPAGSFNFVIKISTILGIILALPVIVYNIIKFIEPALPKKIKSRSIFNMCLISFGLAIVGGAIGYYGIVPLSLHFFLSYSSKTVRPLISANEYLSFITNVLITFALIFQIPLIVLFINHIKPLNPKGILRYQKYIVIASLIIAVLLPFTYDPISQFVLALPILACFYLSVILVKIANRKRIKVGTRVQSDVKAQEPFFAQHKKIEAVPIAEPKPLASITPKPQVNTGTNHARITTPLTRPTKYIDDFVRSRPADTLTRIKKEAVDILPVVESRTEKTVQRSRGSNLSLDGFKFAS